ncbi:MAG TPA: hypothetical protein VFD01_23525 [Candidatus Dormibacteraeota bacterium]|nr:hypothetical protein [Candidatus Dormibacteraeota bacterium]
MSVLGPLQSCAVCGTRTRRTVTWRRQRFACCPSCGAESSGPLATPVPVPRPTQTGRPLNGERPRGGLARDLLRCLTSSPSVIVSGWRP